MKRLASAALCAVLLFIGCWLVPVITADALIPDNLHRHYVSLVTIPSSPADVYTKDAWLLSIELIPQSSSSPTCTVQDRAGTPNVVYNAISLSPHTSYRDTRDPNAPLFMKSGITWSCSDSTVKAQLIVLY